MENEYTFTNEDGEFTVELKDNLWSLKEYKGDNTVLRIPSTFNIDGEEQEINLISTNAFHNTQVEELTIPGTIHYIGSPNNVFNFMGNFPLKKVKLEEGCVLIGGKAFAGYENLEEIIIPKSLMTIGEQAFKDTNITKLEIQKILRPFSIYELSDKKIANKIPSYIINLKEGYSNQADLSNILFGSKINEYSDKSRKIIFSDLDNKQYYDHQHIKSYELIEQYSLTKVPRDSMIDEFIVGEKVKQITNYTLDGASYVKKIFLHDDFENFGKIYGMHVQDDKKDYHWKYNILIEFKNVIYKSSSFAMKNNKVKFDYNVLNTLQLSEEYKEYTNILRKIYTLYYGMNKYEYFPKINIKKLKENVDVLNNNGLSPDDIILFYANTNKNIFKSSLNDIYINYKYLIEQKITPVKNINKIFFKLDRENALTKEELISYILIKYKNERIEDNDLIYTLLTEPNELNQLDLRDRLVSVSTLHLLDNINDNSKISEAKIILGRTNFETMTESDNSNHEIRNTFITALKNNKLDAIRSHIYNKLNSYSNTIFEEMKKLDENTINFYIEDLSISKNWDKYDNRTEKATILKNEFCGRILLAIIQENWDAIINEYSKENNISKKINYSKLTMILQNYIDNINIHKIIEKAKNIDLNDNENIDQYKLLLYIDPYSFQMFDLDKSNEPSRLNQYLAKFSKQQGYLFLGKEKERYSRRDRGFDKINSGKFSAYMEFINNRIEIPVIPKKDRSNYINYIRQKTKNFLKNSSNEDLFEIFKSLELFMRTECETIIQTDEANILSKQIFDRDSNFTNNDRKLYCMYNLNKLAHNTTDVLLPANIINEMRIDFAKRKYLTKDAQIMLSSANDLYHNGISMDEIEIITKNDNYLNVINNWKSSSVKKENIKLNITDKVFNLINSKFKGLTLQKSKNNIDGFINTLDENKEVTSANVYNLLITPFLIEKNETICQEELRRLLEKGQIEKLKFKEISSIIKYKSNIKILDSNKNGKLTLSIDEQKIEINYDEEELNKIVEKMKKFENISIHSTTYSENDRQNLISKVKYYSNQQILFFESKNILQEEMLEQLCYEKLNDKTNKKHIYEFNEKDKLEFYKQNGFIIEVQGTSKDENGEYDLDNLCLVIYSNKFNEPFSVHLKNISEKLKSKLVSSGCLDKNNYTLAHNQIKEVGLTKRENNKVNINDNQVTSAGFQISSSTSNCNNYNFKNYDYKIAKKVYETTKTTGKSINELNEIDRNWYNLWLEINNIVEEKNSEISDMFSENSISNQTNNEKTNQKK